MAMPTAGDDDIAWFDTLLPDAPGVTRRPMFGNLGGFVDGQMFLALLGDRVAVRLDPSARDELLATAGTAPFEPMPGRPMKEYVVLPEAWKDDPEAAGAWIQRSMHYAAALPPKTKPKRSRRAGRRAGPKNAVEAEHVDSPADHDPPTAGPTAAEPPSLPLPPPPPTTPTKQGRAHRAARHRAATSRTTTRSAGRARRTGS